MNTQGKLWLIVAQYEICKAFSWANNGFAPQRNEDQEQGLMQYDKEKILSPANRKL
jgi:hypothetical protein